VRTNSPARTHRLGCAGVLLDMDGVLIDSIRSIERCLREWAADRDLDPDQVVAESKGRRDVELVQRVAPHLNPELEAQEIGAREARTTADVRPINGARELLKSLPARQWAVVTSASGAAARARLAAAGIAQPAVLVTCDDVVAGKPEPECYLTAARRLGVSPKDCIVFEDAPSGTIAGMAAGVGAVIGVAGTVSTNELIDAGVFCVIPDLTFVRAVKAGYGVELVISRSA